MKSGAMKTGESSGLRGHTLRFTWKDGPTRGAVHEHVFHEDGTVEWHGAESTAKAKDGAAERVKFADEQVADGIRMLSYLSKSGYTLTVVLDFQAKSLVGVASNDKTWMPVHGSFDVVH